MNENAKKLAEKRNLIEKLSEKYDKKDELTETKKEVLKTWIKSIDTRESQRNPNDDKEKALVLKLWKQIEAREKKKASR
jgi:hypothetical protein